MSSTTRLSDEKLASLCAKINDPDTALDVLLGDPEVVEDLLVRHAELGNIGPSAYGADLGLVGSMANSFIATRHLSSDRRYLLKEQKELTHPEAFLSEVKDKMSRLAANPAPRTEEEQAEFTQLVGKAIWIMHALNALASLGHHLALEDGTTRKALALYSTNGLKSGEELRSGVRELLTLRANSDMKLHVTDIMLKGDEGRWCQTVYGKEISSLTLPEEPFLVPGRKPNHKCVMHYEISVDCGTLCLADDFRMSGYQVWKDLNPSTIGSLNHLMGQNLAFSEALRRCGAFFIPTENHAFRTMLSNGKLVAAKAFDLDEAALPAAARERGVSDEDLELWLSDGATFELAISRATRTRHEAVLQAIGDLLPQRNMTSTVWGISGIGREMLIELAAEGIQHVIDNPSLKTVSASDIRKQIKLLGPHARLIAETQFSAMIEEGYVDVHELQPGTWHIYKFNAHSQDYSDFTEAMTAAMPDMPGMESIAFVLSQDAIDIPQGLIVDLERPVQRRARDNVPVLISEISL